MAAWPPDLPALKLDLGVEDTRDDLRLQQVLDAAVSKVEEIRGGTGVGDVNFTGLMNVNTADSATLQTLDGVDADIAQDIIDGRPYLAVVDVEDVVGSTVFDGIEQDITVASDPSDDLVLGTLRLAARWHTRRRSPDLLVAAGELGTTRVPGFDSDIERLLGVGRFRGATFA